MDTRGKILQQLIHVGELLLTNGAEVKRVEETIVRMGRAYGCLLYTSPSPRDA